MADAPISGLTQFAPAAGLLIPVVDPAAPPGLKNGYITIAALQAFLAPGSSSSGGTSGGTTSSVRSLKFSVARNSNNLALF